MSLSTLSRSLALVVLVAAGCAGGAPPRSDEPTTARDKQRRETEAKGDQAPGGKWGGWRYTGDRNDCFFVVGRRCFKTEASACAAARCGQHKCEITGGGPASVGCAK
jgi:hypothetical protein